MRIGSTSGAFAKIAEAARHQKGSVPEGTLPASLRLVDANLMRGFRWSRPQSLAHLRNRPIQSVGLAEAARLAACLPILFSRSTGGGFAPVAAVSLVNGGATRLGPGDSLPARYIPTLAGIYPFLPVLKGDTAALGVDMASGHVFAAPDGDEAFGETDGTPTPYIATLRDALPRVIADHKRAVRAVAILEKHGALTPIRAGAKTGLNAPLPLFSANPDKVARLTGAALEELWTSGAAQLLHAHLMSLNHLHDLLRKPVVPSMRPAQEAPVVDDEDGGFLDALMGDLAREDGQ